MSNQELDRQAILSAVAEYFDKYHNVKKDFTEGQRIPYASRVYDSNEAVNLVDSALEFWLTSGRYTDKFEKELAAYLGVRFCALVNSGSSANLLAFMTLTSPLLGDRRVFPGDEVITVAAGFPTTVTPIIQYGAIPVFVDVTIPQYNATVKVMGSVLYPNSVTYQPGKNLKYYAKAAGGFDNNARRSRAFVIYMNGMVASGMSAEVRPGCIIIIPSKSYREPVKWNEVISMLSSTASVSAVVLSAINLATK